MSPAKTVVAALTRKKFALLWCGSGGAEAEAGAAAALSASQPAMAVVGIAAATAGTPATIQKIAGRCTGG